MIVKVYHSIPGAPLTYFTDGGGGSERFFEFEILAERDFLDL